MTPQANARSVDAACRKVTVTLHIRNGDPITCEGLEFHSIAGEAMVAHRTPWQPKSWQVTEPVTGYLITNGHKTRNESMIAAQTRVNKRPGCLAEAVRIHNLANGMTPYALRVRDLESEGMTTSDAQAIADTENLED